MPDPASIYWALLQLGSFGLVAAAFLWTFRVGIPKALETLNAIIVSNQKSQESRDAFHQKSLEALIAARSEADKACREERDKYFDVLASLYKDKPKP